MNSPASPNTFAAHWPKIQLVEVPTSNIVHHTQQRIENIRGANVTNIAPAWQIGTIRLRERHTTSLEQTIDYLRCKIRNKINYIELRWVTKILQRTHPEVDISYTLQMIIESICLGYARSLTFEQRQAYQWTEMPDDSQLAIQLPVASLDYAIQKTSSDMICRVYETMFPRSNL